MRLNKKTSEKKLQTKIDGIKKMAEEGELTMMGMAWLNSMKILASSSRFSNATTAKVLITLTDGKYVMY